LHRLVKIGVYLFTEVIAKLKPGYRSFGPLCTCMCCFQTANLQHRAVSLPQHGFFVDISDHSDAEITVRYADFHGRDAKSRHTTKIHGDLEYVIMLQR